MYLIKNKYIVTFYINYLFQYNEKNNNLKIYHNLKDIILQ